MKKKVWNVTLPIAGHAHLVVEADDEYGAIDAAMEQVTSDHFEGWEAVRQFVQGNVCYCPSPWQAEATEEADD
jgi:hypothetical protein